MTADALARRRVGTVERLMEASAEVHAAMRADELEDAAIERSRLSVRRILANLKAAGEHDREHDRHLTAAAEQLYEALGVLEGIEQQQLPFPEERAS